MRHVDPAAQNAAEAGRPYRCTDESFINTCLPEISAHVLNCIHAGFLSPPTYRGHFFFKNPTYRLKDHSKLEKLADNRRVFIVAELDECRDSFARTTTESKDLSDWSPTLYI